MRPYYLATSLERTTEKFEICREETFGWALPMIWFFFFNFVMEQYLLNEWNISFSCSYKKCSNAKLNGANWWQDIISTFLSALYLIHVVLYKATKSKLSEDYLVICDLPFDKRHSFIDSSVLHSAKGIRFRVVVRHNKFIERTISIYYIQVHTLAENILLQTFQSKTKNEKKRNQISRIVVSN